MFLDLTIKPPISNHALAQIWQEAREEHNRRLSEPESRFSAYMGWKEEVLALNGIDILTKDEREEIIENLKEFVAEVRGKERR